MENIESKNHKKKKITVNYKDSWWDSFVWIKKTKRARTKREK